MSTAWMWSLAHNRYFAIIPITSRWRKSPRPPSRLFNTSRGTCSLSVMRRCMVQSIGRITLPPAHEDEVVVEQTRSSPFHSQGVEVRFSSEDSFRSDLVDLLSLYQAMDVSSHHQSDLSLLRQDQSYRSFSKRCSNVLRTIVHPSRDCLMSLSPSSYWLEQRMLPSGQL